MGLIRLSDLSKKDASRIRARQNHGTMSTVFDNEQYLCCLEEELDNWKSKKTGRKAIVKFEAKGQ